MQTTLNKTFVFIGFLLLLTSSVAAGTIPIDTPLAASSPQLYDISFSATNAFPNDLVVLNINGSYDYGYAYVYVNDSGSTYYITTIYLSSDANSSSFVINQYWRSGAYYIDSIDLYYYDGSYNEFMFQNNYSMQYLNVYNTTPDITGPTVTNAQFTTPAITTYGDTNVSVIVTATDNGSGLGYGYADIYAINGSTPFYYTTIYIYPISATTMYGSIFTSFDNDSYFIYDIDIYDNMDNYAYASNGTDYVSNILQITSLVDNSNPTITAAWFNPTYTEFADATVFVNITDVGSGVQYASVTLKSSFGISNSITLFYLGGNTWYADFNPSDFGSGFFNITFDYIYANDQTGNYVYDYGDYGELVVNYTEENYINYVDFIQNEIRDNESTTVSLDSTAPFEIFNVELQMDFYHQENNLYYGTYTFYGNGTVFDINPSNYGIYGSVYGYITKISYTDSSNNHYNQNSIGSEYLYINNMLVVQNIYYEPSTISEYDPTIIHIDSIFNYSISTVELDIEFFDMDSNTSYGHWLINGYTFDFQFYPSDYMIPSHSFGIARKLSVWTTNGYSFETQTFANETLTINGEPQELKLSLDSDHPNFQSQQNDFVRFDLRIESGFYHDMRINWTIQVFYGNNLVFSYSNDDFLYSQSYIIESVSVQLENSGDYRVTGHVIDDKYNTWSTAATFTVVENDITTTDTTDTNSNSSIPTLENPLPGFEFSVVAPVFVMIAAIIRKRKYN